MKNPFTLLVLAACVSAFGRSESTESSWVTVKAVQIVPENKVAQVELQSSQWGTTVYAVDLSAQNPYGSAMLSQVVSSMVSGSQIRFTVSISQSEYGADCEPGTAPQCDWGDLIKQLWLAAP